jgi:hypothetical protein
LSGVSRREGDIIALAMLFDSGLVQADHREAPVHFA